MRIQRSLHEVVVFAFAHETAGAATRPGATGTTYTLDQVDVGEIIAVTGSYLDGSGTTESVTSEATSIVENVNDDVTGTVTISGIPEEDQSLVASNTLADELGL